MNSTVVDRQADNRSTGVIRTIKAYIALTKPRVIELLLLTTAPVMILANQGIPSLWLIFATLFGGALSAGSAGVFNCYCDRDIDRVMNRTMNRPLVTGEISSRNALIFAWSLGVVAIFWLGFTVNWLCAILSLAAILFYVLVYTLVLKRRTAQNIIWGGAAGCMPVLIGWSAVTPPVSWAPWVLFGVIFLWTPAHYWPLSMKYRDDYHRAGVPMLPVIRGKVFVGVQTVLYAWATVACSLLLVLLAPMGYLYLVVAILAGCWFIYEAQRLSAATFREENVQPMRVFHASISYLTVLFLAVALDPLLSFPIG